MVAVPPRGAIKDGTGTSLSVAGALGSSNGLNVNGTVTFTNAAQTIASLTKLDRALVVGQLVQARDDF